MPVSPVGVGCMLIGHIQMLLDQEMLGLAYVLATSLISNNRSFIAGWFSSWVNHMSYLWVILDSIHISLVDT